MRRLLPGLLPLLLLACTEPPQAPTPEGSPVSPLITTTGPAPITPAEAPPEPGVSQVSSQELELAIDMVRALTGGPEQIPDKPEMTQAQIDALLYKIAMDPEASAIYAHETSPSAASEDPSDMDRSPPPRTP